eukprot:CAMPEP_0172199636 /NCGR_PEP_ID=MMETSP1050-20130122/28808_1 /TAXON_ID=233186 /ORGANISM="Cryptomonas curvata, Strain CCAP979/52" /LENGTH=341 /DNA_ID=CAMNT_0012876701 /DNA_START=10 /DNA_END=1032 /DNA_ORIENTATION=+
MSVNSIIASRKGAKRKKSGRAVEASQFLEAEPSTLENQICDIEEIISRYKENCVYATSYKSGAAKEDESIENKKLQGLLSLAESRLSLKASYVKLGALFGFGVIYVLTLFLQRDVQSAYGIETSVIMSNLMLSLPLSGSGLFSNGGGPGSTGLLSSNENLLTWLGESVIPVLFQDAVCGDGKCEAPEEEKGYGRFGCIKDCGRNTETVSLNVRAESIVQSYYKGRVRPDLDASFKYNIFSQQQNDYIFEKPIGNASARFDVLRTDELTFYLYQTNSLSDEVDAGRIRQYLRLLEPSLPPRNATTDFFYGDPREALAVAAAGVKAAEDYCASGPGDDALCGR